MRSLTALIFCLFCSCTYIEDYIGISTSAEIPASGGTTSSSLKSPDGKINASSEQSKHLETASLPAEAGSPQSSDITKNYLVLDLDNLKPGKPGNSEIAEIYPFNNSVDQTQIDLLTVNQNGEVFYWDGKSSYKKSYKLMDIAPGFYSVSVSPHNSLLAAAYSGLIEIYDLRSHAKLYTMKRIASRISSMEFSPQGDSLLMAGVDAVVYRWQFILEQEAETIIDAEKSLERYIGHSAVVNLVRFHPYGRVFVSSDWGGALNAWLLYNQDKYQGEYDVNIFAGRLFTEDVNRAHGSRKAATIVEQIKFSTDGQFFYLADEEGAIEIWMVRGFKQVFSIAAHKGKIYDISLSPLVDRLASLSRDGKLKIWQIVSKDSKTPGTKDYELQPLKEIPLNDIKHPEARKIIYLAGDKAILADRDGVISVIDVKV
jgi:WD40 repeat protein